VSLDADRTPVIVAVGQAESRDLRLGPLALAGLAGREALDGAQGLAAAIERLTLVNILSSRAGMAPASELVAALGLRDVARETTTIGGNTPQSMVERAAGDIAAGRLTATLILGAEAVRSGRMGGGGAPAEPAPASGAPANGGGGAPAGAGTNRPQRPAGAVGRTSPRSGVPSRATTPDPVVGADQPDLSDEEHMTGLLIPLHVYALFESVLAARAGRSPAQQRDFIGQLMAPFTEVAARNPHAWFRQARSANELATITPENRLVVEPYVKTTVAFLGPAQAAALVVTSLGVARALKLDDGAMFVVSGASANDVWYPMARPDIGRSAGLEAAAAAALRMAGVTVDDVSDFDLYSCFPSAVQIAAASLGLPVDVGNPDQARRLTLTGGLPYFGGPGNNYGTHAIAAMFELFRAAGAGAKQPRIGLVTGVGWYLTKHSVGIYASAPPSRGYEAADTTVAQEAIDATAIRRLKVGEAASTTATVEASTVFYDRDTTPVAAPVLATLEDGRRVAASADDGEVAGIAGTFLVGARIHVEAVAGAHTAPRYRLLGLP
jgi:acetyl-CoA C-acetyltransferase